MAIEELTRLAESLYGKRWRGPLARSLGCNKRLIQFYERGERRISREKAANIRELAKELGLGPAAIIIRSIVQQTIPSATYAQSHEAAVGIVTELKRHRLIKTG